MKVEPLKPEYRDREARLAVADAQGLDAVLLFPTLGCGVEEALRHDIPATMASLSAFNRWLEEDWGFSHRDRLIGVPMLSLADPEAALAELDSLIARGARIVHVRPAPVPAANGTGRSLGDSDTTRCGRASPRRRSPSRSTSATAATTRSPRRGAPAEPSRASARPTCSAACSSRTAPSTTRWRA